MKATGEDVKRSGKPPARVAALLLLVLILTCSGLTSACVGAPEKTEGAKLSPRKIADIPYVHDGSPRQIMDVYIPRGRKGPHPVVVWIHGGSWMYGNKSEQCLAADCLSDRFVVASIDYRYSTDAPFPAQLVDCKAAIRFLRANARKYDLDPQRIGVWGTSAGGYLAAMVGTTSDVPFLEGKIGEKRGSSRVQAVCDWSGPTDFFSAPGQAKKDNKFKLTGPGSAVYSLLFTNTHPQALLSASPVNYVTPDDPPFLIMHGDQDDAVPPQQSRELYDYLKKAGVHAELHILKGRGHSFYFPQFEKMARDFFIRTLCSTQKQSDKSK